MGNWKKHYSTEHLDSADLDGKTVNIKIVAISDEEMDGDGGAKEKKMRVKFEPSPGLATLTNKRTWIAAKTCGYCLEAMFGKDDDAWVGKWVTIKAERISTGDDALRVVGSPDISRPCSVKVRQFGRGKLTINLRPTPMHKAGGGQTQASPPADDQDFGTPPPLDDEPGSSG